MILFWLRRLISWNRRTKKKPSVGYGRDFFLKKKKNKKNNERRDEEVDEDADQILQDGREWAGPERRISMFAGQNRRYRQSEHRGDEDVDEHRQPYGPCDFYRVQPEISENGQRHSEDQPQP